MARGKRSVNFYADLNRFSTADIYETRKNKRRAPSLGIYKAERLIAVKKRKSEEPIYLVKWLEWGSEHNTWEPESNIFDENLLRYFRNPTPSTEILEEHLERFLNTITSGLCEPLATKSTFEMRHDVLRRVVKKRLASKHKHLA